MDIPVYSIAGQVVGQVAVDADLLGGLPNRELIRQALVRHEANQRVGTAKAKTRREVSGSGRKLWRQKGSGRARAGSRKNPVWVGGGVTHGPRPRSYRQGMPRTARRRALHSAFLAKAMDGEVIALDGLELPEAKTKAMAAILRNLDATRSFLIVLPEHDVELWRCTRNIPGAAMTTYRELNAYGMIRPRRVIFLLEALHRFLQDAESMSAPAEVPAEAAEAPADAAGAEVGVSEDG